MPEPIIRVENVTRIYHVGDVDVHALRGVNLIVERGEFIAIMGSSGSGKSTLMALLGCLDRPTSGDYYFEGVDVARLSEPELARIRSERLGFRLSELQPSRRAPAQSRTSHCRCSMRRRTGRSAPRASSARERRSICSVSAIASAIRLASSRAASSSGLRSRAH